MNDIRRIAFVTRHFLELQGLTPAATGGALLFSAVMCQALSTSARPGSATQVILFGLVSSSLASAFFQRCYKRMYGDVVTSWTQKWMATLPTALVSVGACIDMSRAFRQGSAGASAAAMLLAAYSLGIVARDWRWRPHHLVGAAAGLAGAIATASLTSAPNRLGTDPLNESAYLLAYTLMGFALVVTGLFDHHLLASSLRPGPARGDAPEPSPVRGVAVLRTWFAAAVCIAAAASSFAEPRWIGLSFPMALFAALYAAMMVTAMTQAAQGVRDFRRNTFRVRPVPVLSVDVPASSAMVTVALAAAIQSALFAGKPPLLLTATVAAACVGLALTNWQRRKAYLLIAMAAVAVLPVLAHADAGRGLVVAVFAIALGFVLHGLVACWRAVVHGNIHADTV